MTAALEPMTPEEIAVAQSQTGWTDARTRLLRIRHDEGLSCAQIARELKGVSRNAVIGKIHRMGMVRPEISRPTKAPERPTRAQRSQESRPTIGATAKAPPATDGSAANRFGIAGNGVVYDRSGSRPPRVQVPQRQDPPGKVNVLTIRARQCRWPIGDPTAETFTFCGDRTREGKSYCADHAERAYVPTPAPKTKSQRTAQGRAA